MRTGEYENMSTGSDIIHRAYFPVSLIGYKEMPTEESKTRENM